MLDNIYVLHLDSIELQCFSDMNLSTQQAMMLSWIVGWENACEAVRGSLEVYFNQDAWKKVRQMIENRRHAAWFCGKCHKNCSKTHAVICERCLQWFHFKACAKLLEKPVGDWFCEECQEFCLNGKNE